MRYGATRRGLGAGGELAERREIGNTLRPGWASRVAESAGLARHGRWRVVDDAALKPPA